MCHICLQVKNSAVPAFKGNGVFRLCKIIKYQYVLFVFLLFLGCATNRYYVPLREVDKTINLPEGSKNLLAYFGASIYPDTTLYDVTWLVSPQVSYGITNNLCYPLFPLPALQYAVVNNNRIVNDTVFINNFNVSLIGGLTGFAYSRGDGLSPRLIFGVYSKYRINNHFWYNIDLQFNSNFSQYVNEYLFLSNINVGMQISNTWFSSISYVPHFDMYRYSRYWVSNDYLEHEGRITIGLNPNCYFGLRFFGGYLYHPENFYKHSILIGSSLQFSW